MTEEQRPPRRAWRPYLPATVTIVIGVLFFIIFQRPIDNWFQGRPLTLGEPSAVTTLDLGPMRLGAAVRPHNPYPGEAELFLGVGDALGTLLPGAEIEASVGDKALKIEAAGDGRFRAKVHLPKGEPVEIHIHGKDAQGGHGHATVVLEAGKTGVQTDGAVDGIAFYTCPMHPSIRTPAPDDCPICGMDLVPVTTEEVITGAVRVDARRRQLIGVKTEVLGPRNLRRIVRAAGIAAWDETKEVHITARADGWVEHLYADHLGKRVEKGDPLVSLYIPEIRAAELELIAAVRGQRQAQGTMLEENAKRLRSAAYDKLQLLGVSSEELRRVLRQGKPEPAITIDAPIDGIVMEKPISRGSPIVASQPMLTLGVLDPIWVLVHVYEQDMALVEPGMTAEVTFPYIEGDPYQGTVTFIEPVIDANTRTQRVRITLNNPDEQIRPGMFAHAVLSVDRPETLVVPHEAVIFSGPRKIVFVDQGSGYLKPVEVQLGIRGESGWEVRSGLQEGQRVVTSGNFLLAAESRLRSAVDAW